MQALLKTRYYSKRIKWFYIVIASDPALAGERACTPECLPQPKRFVQINVSARRRGNLTR